MTKAPMLNIAILCDRKVIAGSPFHSVGEKYIKAISDYLSANVVLLPALPQSMQMLLNADGLMLTGSHSNIDPSRYGENNNFEDDLRDASRDEFSGQLIRSALENDIPILGICRGFQELNVELGGTMHQRLIEIDGLLEHRENKDDPIDLQYEKSHEVNLVPSGVLENAYKTSSISVNSLHMQGVNRLAESLVAEATSPDGLIEAFRIDRSDRFVLAVQWHPEWKVIETPDYQVLFDLFAEACAERKVAQ